MKIVVNGAGRTVQEETSVESLLADEVPGDASLGVAVALNGEVVPKKSWSVTLLGDGDRVEVLRAIGGG